MARQTAKKKKAARSRRTTSKARRAPPGQARSAGRGERSSKRGRGSAAVLRGGSTVLPPRLFILGAGFSAAAGLPLASDLLPLVLDVVEREVGRDNHLANSLAAYREFVRDTTGQSADPIDLERFAEYLDYQHSLEMLGSDTWSDDGNRDQNLLRWGIGSVLHSKTPGAARLPQVYLDFARRLRRNDIVVTFNYDLVLERALSAVGRPYRRFPSQFESVGPSSSVVEQQVGRDDVILLKLHGSIDWLDRASYDRTLRGFELGGRKDVADHIRSRDTIFGNGRLTTTQPLTQGPRPDGDPLASIEVIDNIDRYYASAHVAYSHAPLVLAPSRAKLLYGGALRPFWRELGGGSVLLGGLVVVGYSLPDGDPYARQVLWRVANGYRTALRDPKWRLGPVTRIQVIDLRATPEAQADLRNRWRFLDPGFTDFAMTGLNLSTVRAALSAEREVGAGADHPPQRLPRRSKR